MATWEKGTFSAYKKQKKGKGKGNKPGDPGEPGDGGEPGEPGKPGDGGEPGDGSGNVPSQDDLQKDIESKLGKREEAGAKPSDADADADAGKPKPKASKAGQPGKQGMSDLESRKAEIDQIVPKLNWKSLIKLLVSSSVEAIDTSYAKPSRRGLTGVAIAAQTGAGALKPGELIREEKHNKIVLVFDTSGSMHGAIPTVMAETRNLLKQLGKSRFPISIVFFAGNAKWFQVNISENEWYEITNVADISKPKPKSGVNKDWTKLLTMGASGGTVFGGPLVSDLTMLAGQGYNVMLFSDSDMLYGDNYKNFIQLYLSHKNKIFWVCDSLGTFRSACTQLGQVPKTFSYLS